MGVESAPAKRKRNQSKRGQYVSCACFECKRRKIKCNGERPCGRCGNLHLDCLYPEPTTIRKRRKTDLKSMVDGESIGDVSAGDVSISPGPAETPASHTPTNDPLRYLNPRMTAESSLSDTSSPAQVLVDDFSFGDVNADTSWKFENTFTASAKGFVSSIDAPLPVDSLITSYNSDDLPSTLLAARFERTYLHGISYTEARQMIDKYDSEINCLYPMFTVYELATTFDNIYRHYASGGKLSTQQQGDLLNAQVMIAIGTTLSGLHSEACKSLYSDALAKVERRIVTGKASVSLLVHFLLIHQFQFHSDMGTVAYRSIGICAMMALELGLHKKREVDQIDDPLIRDHYRTVFWSLYILDRRLSIYVRRPFTLRDEEIDQVIPAMSSQSRATEDPVRMLHFDYMIHYSKLSGHILETLNKSRSTEVDRNKIEYLVSLLEGWKSSLPPELRLFSATQDMGGSHTSRKVKWIVYLKSNLVLLSIYQACGNEAYLQPAIFTACECIRGLARLYFYYDFYTECEIQYNHFLVAALEVLYGSLLRAPYLLQECTAEIKLALKIISLILKGSSFDKRQGSIWQMVVSFAYKFGLKSPFRQSLPPTAQPESYAPQEQSYQRLQDTLLYQGAIS